jgi:hypothetical protein
LTLGDLVTHGGEQMFAFRAVGFTLRVTRITLDFLSQLMAISYPLLTRFYLCGYPSHKTTIQRGCQKIRSHLTLLF